MVDDDDGHRGAGAGAAPVRSEVVLHGGQDYVDRRTIDRGWWIARDQVDGALSQAKASGVAAVRSMAGSSVEYDCTLSR